MSNARRPGFLAEPGTHQYPALFRRFSLSNSFSLGAFQGLFPLVSNRFPAGNPHRFGGVRFRLSGCCRAVVNPDECDIGACCRTELTLVVR